MQSLIKLSGLIPLLLLFVIPARSAEPARDDGVVLYEATVSGTPIRIVAAKRPFDPKAHQTTDLHNAGTEEKPNWKGATVDGRPVAGADQTLPAKGTSQLDRLTVYFGDQRVEVPQKLLHPVFIPHLTRSPGVFTKEYGETIVSVSRDAKCVIIDLAVGDGGGTGSVVFVVSSDGTVSNEYPRRPEP